MNGSGYVYAPNPVQYHGDWTSISDNGDTSSTLLNSARVSVTLQGLDPNTGLLKGEFVDMTLPKQGKPVPDADELDRNYFYSRDNQRFEQVVVYHTVDSIQRYFHMLGFDDDTGIANGIRDFPALANAHWYKQNQSFYSTGDDAIHFGDGGVDDGKHYPEDLVGSDCVFTDSDGDGLSDTAEGLLGTSPFNPHSDGDTLTNGEEVMLGTNSLDADTDADGFNDDVEDAAGTKRAE